MMPMPMRRNSLRMQKAENLYCTATGWKILPASRIK
jgi:hypothetical protein